MFVVACLSETSRSPFDLSEAETELLAGFHVELAAVGFTLSFMAESSNILTVAFTMALL